MKKARKILLVIVMVFVALQVAGITLSFFLRRIKPNTVLTMRMAGEIPEQPTQDTLRELVAGPEISVTDIVEGLDRARSDPRISGVELRITESDMNMGKIQELREKIREFNRAGKFSVAYLEFATNRSYYLASACQTVVLLPSSMLYVRGLMASTTFYRGALDKLGVVADLYHVGEYKNAINVYTEKKFTPAHREVTQALIDDWYQEYIRGVAEARGLTPQGAQKAIESGPLNAEEALQAKLVDRVAYWDEMRELVRHKNQGSDNRLNVRAYLSRTSRDTRSQLAVIYATGEILPGLSGTTPFGEEVVGSETIAEQFRRVREDESVKAVVLRIDSPGGAALAAEVIRHEVELTKREKPVVVSMSDVAASGGYWIAMSANRIVAEPGTLTGSIGVYTGKFNILGLYEKLGLTKDFVQTSENSTLEYPFQNYTPAQRASVQKYMRDTYTRFLAGVAEGRHMKVQDVDKIAQGRVWTGERARQLGLVDEMGGLHTALLAARRLARIPAEQTLSLIYLPPRRTLLDRILDLMGGAEVGGATVSPRAWLRSMESLASYPVWAILPGVPEVQ